MRRYKTTISLDDTEVGDTGNLTSEDAKPLVANIFTVKIGSFNSIIYVQ